MIWRRKSDEDLWWMLSAGALVFDNIEDLDHYDNVARVRYMLVEEMERRGLDLTLWTLEEIMRSATDCQR